MARRGASGQPANSGLTGKPAVANNGGEQYDLGFQHQGPGDYDLGSPGTGSQLVYSLGWDERAHRDAAAKAQAAEPGWSARPSCSGTAEGSEHQGDGWGLGGAGSAGGRPVQQPGDGGLLLASSAM